MQAWWSGNAAELLANEAEAIVRRLALRLVETHHLNRDTQLHAWRQQIALLRTALRGLPDTWRVLFEYPLLRLGRRIDTVLLTEAAILVLEFKVGATTISVLDRQQTEDYALDLFDFHAESRAHPVVPILVRDAIQGSRGSMAVALARCHSGIRRVRSHAGITAARHHDTHPRAGATARFSRLGSCAVSAGADDRRGGNHAVQSPWRR